MMLQRGVVAAYLAGESAGAQIAGGANFKRNRSFAQSRGQSGVASDGDAVADALGAENVERVADGVRPADFSGMGHAMQAAGRGEFEHWAKIGGGESKFVAADTESDHSFGAQFDGGTRGVHSRARAELPHAIENPLQTQTERFEDADGLADGAEV